MPAGGSLSRDRRLFLGLEGNSVRRWIRKNAYCDRKLPPIHSGLPPSASSIDSVDLLRANVSDWIEFNRHAITSQMASSFSSPDFHGSPSTSLLGSREAAKQDRAQEVLRYLLEIPPSSCSARNLVAMRINRSIRVGGPLSRTDEISPSCFSSRLGVCA
jgi:hypothetical protein